MKNKSVCLLLLTILISSSILIYKIENTNQYNPEIYKQVYEEYEHITNVEANLQETQDIEDVIKDSQLSSNPIIVNKNSSGDTYKTIGIINIPKINISYPIINDCTEENLNIAPTKLLGPSPNSVGNLVIVGHNNWNKEFFSNLHKLENDDIVEITDATGKKLTYRVYDKYEIKQDDFSCLNQNTNRRTELTLITCIKYKKNKRLVVKCVAD